MTESLFETVRYLFVVAVLAALWWPDAESDGRRARFPRSIWLGGIGLGAVLTVAYLRLDARTLGEAIVMLAVAALVAPLPAAAWRAARRWSRGLGLAAIVVLLAQRAGAVISFVVYKSQDRVMVASSELLLFHAGVALGIALVAIAGAALLGIARDSEPWLRRSAITGIVMLLFCEHLSWGYHALALSGWVSLPRALFPVVVWIINRIPYFGYAQAVLAAVFGAVGFLLRRRPGSAGSDGMLHPNPASRRLYRWRVRKQWCHAVVFLVSVAAATGASLYYQLYASQPLRQAAAERLEARAGSLVISVASYGPGEVRHYAYAPEDGRLIRFLVLKDETGTMRAAYDACRMCGAKGYVKQGKELICLACGTAIHGPTVGREGGCNPIPLKHVVEKETLVIAVEDLTGHDGARLFARGGKVAS
ncbi:MAG: DUF2318 domain-containing protein [Candidatus Schekmanbacteria bacterium]|nr:DUF2318 domain-containing protein [Candidatus Schekmanbacteria bacterium]